MTVDEMMGILKKNGNCSDNVSFYDILKFDYKVEIENNFGNKFGLISVNDSIYANKSYVDSDGEEHSDKIIKELIDKLDKKNHKSDVLTILHLLGFVRKPVTYCDEPIYYVFFINEDEDVRPLYKLCDVDEVDVYTYDDALDIISEVRSDFPSYYGYIVDVTPVLWYLKG